MYEQKNEVNEKQNGEAKSLYAICRYRDFGEIRRKCCKNFFFIFFKIRKTLSNIFLNDFFDYFKPNHIVF